jgi:hypothetical protein
VASVTADKIRAARVIGRHMVLMNRGDRPMQTGVAP